MKLISWNVNGVRAAIRKGFLEFLQDEKPDIICLQEIKISDLDISKAAFDFQEYKEFWCTAKKPGYSGTAILIKDSLLGKEFAKIEMKTGLGVDEFDDEGRTQILETPDFYLINAYFPNSRADLSRLDYKIEFNELMWKMAKKLEKTKPVIITGDFNVAHNEIDLARPKQNEGESGFTPEERASFSKLLKLDFIDTFRSLNPEKIQYSWWSFRAGARIRNVGWRIDYFCVSAKLNKTLKKAYILDKITASDHAPIGLEI